VGRKIGFSAAPFEPGMLEEVMHGGSLSGVLLQHGAKERSNFRGEIRGHQEVANHNLVEDDLSASLRIIKRKESREEDEEKNTKRPDVRLLAVVQLVLYNFGGDVMNASALVSLFRLDALALLVGFLRLRSKSKVNELELVGVFVVHDVLQLDISVTNLLSVQSLHRLEELVEDPLANSLGDTVGILSTVVAQVSSIDILGGETHFPFLFHHVVEKEEALSLWANSELLKDINLPLQLLHRVGGEVGVVAELERDRLGGTDVPSKEDG